MREFVTDGGMTCLRELPKQEKTKNADKYYDQFDTYSPFKWKGSRRMTEDELARYFPEDLF